MELHAGLLLTYTRGGSWADNCIIVWGKDEPKVEGTEAAGYMDTTTGTSAAERTVGYPGKRERLYILAQARRGQSVEEAVAARTASANGR